MIWNIIDRRNRPYRWNRINAIIEDVEHDNGCDDADQAPEADAELAILYAQRERVSVAEAVNWAAEQSSPVTLYLYDENDGTANLGDAEEMSRTVHFDDAGQDRSSGQ